MAVEITNAGYQTLRDFVQANWNYVEIRNDTGAAVLRIATSDPRCAWLHTPGAPVLQLQVIISGADLPSLPLTLAGAAFFNTPTGGDALAETTFTAATLTTIEDQLKLILNIEIPQQV